METNSAKNLICGLPFLSLARLYLNFFHSTTHLNLVVISLHERPSSDHMIPCLLLGKPYLLQVLVAYLTVGAVLLSISDFHFEFTCGTLEATTPCPLLVQASIARRQLPASVDSIVCLACSCSATAQPSFAHWSNHTSSRRAVSIPARLRSRSSIYAVTFE